MTPIPDAATQRSPCREAVMFSIIRRTLPLLLLAVAPAGAAAQEVPLESVELPDELDRVLRDYERAWRAGDAAALSVLFASDGMVPNESGWVRGREGIRAAYSQAGGDLRLRAVAYAVSDSVGYIVGAYGYGETDGTSDRGRFVLALRRGAGGRWLIAADLDRTIQR